MSDLDFEFDTWTQQDVRDFCELIGDAHGDWQGVPVPLGDDMPVVVQPKHPMKSFFDVTPGYAAPKKDNGLYANERLINSWVDRQRNRQVFVIECEGRYSALVLPLAPDRSMERLTYWVNTLGGTQAWNLEAEYTARERLIEMLNDHQWRQYELTGAFLETSPRSKVTYLFRRLRPTVALSPRNRDPENDSMRCLAILCLHPVAYYANSWAGCMVPSDDVIAHLSMMRGDEAMFWGKSVQHAAHEPEAGL